MQDWWRDIDKKKSVRIFPPDFRDSSYRKDIFILDYMDRIRPSKKEDPIVDYMRKFNSIKRAISRKNKIKKILG